MATTSISTYSTSSVKYNLVPTSTLFLSGKTKPLPGITSSAPVSAPSTPNITPLKSSSAITLINGGETEAVNAGTTGSTSVNSDVTSTINQKPVQQRRQPPGPPLRLVIQQRRHSQRHRSTYGSGHPLMQQIQTYIRNNSQSNCGYLLSPCHEKTPYIQLAGKLEDVMSSQLSQESSPNTIDSTKIVSPAKAEEEQEGCCSDYVYTAPCEHHPSKGQTEYLVNDMFPKLEHDLSTIEFGIRISDFMPLAFKTVPVAGLVEKELELLNYLRGLPNVIQLQDSFVNDNGNTVLVLPMLKKFDCHVANKSLCSIRASIKQVLMGLAAVHAKNIVHLDINPSNLMLTHNKREVVIIDFGLSMSVNRFNFNGDNASPSLDPIPVCGTTGYIAPEIINPQFYGQYDPTEADLYSLGIVLGEMLEPYIPDCDLHYFGSKYLSLENTNQTVRLLKEFISQKSVYPAVLIQAADLLVNMLEEDPKSRKSAQELLDSHPFLNTPPLNDGSGASPGSCSAMKLELSDWLHRVQEIKYYKYLCREQNDCEVYRYR